MPAPGGCCWLLLAAVVEAQLLVYSLDHRTRAEEEEKQRGRDVGGYAGLIIVGPLVSP